MQVVFDISQSYNIWQNNNVFPTWRQHRCYFLYNTFQYSLPYCPLDLASWISQSASPSLVSHWNVFHQFDMTRVVLWILYQLFLKRSIEYFTSLSKSIVFVPHESHAICWLVGRSACRWVAGPVFKLRYHTNKVLYYSSTNRFSFLIKLKLIPLHSARINNQDN
jgi:hypothetical protein